MSLLLLLIVVLLLVAALPAWPYSRDWGYYPTGILAFIALVVLIVVLLGY